MNYSRYSYINPNDIDLFGTLSKNRGISLPNLWCLFARRGILFGKDTPRDYLAKEFSSYFHSSYDYHIIEAALATSQRKTAVSGVSLQNLDEQSIFTDRQICKQLDILEKEIIDKIKSDYENINVDTAIFKKNGAVSRQIDIRYSKYDFTKNAFNRRDRKEASIVIRPLTDSNSLYIEYPNLKEINFLLNEKVLPVITEKFPTSEKLDIDLSGITDQSKRKLFFDLLIHNVKGYNYDTVIDIFVTKPEENKDKEEDEDSFSSTSVASIRKASFSGQGLMDVPELDHLLDKGYHIYKVVWQSHSQEANELSVFESKFSDPDNCNDFSYIFKGTYQANGKISSSSVTETSIANRSIYLAAVESLKALGV